MSPGGTASTETLLGALLARSDGPPVSILAGSHGEERSLVLDEFLSAAERMAQHLNEMGVAQGDRVATLLPTGPTLLAVLIATWMRRAAIIPLATPAGRADLSRAKMRLAGTVRAAAPKVLIGTDATLVFAKASMDSTDGPRLVPETELLRVPESRANPLLAPNGEDVALIQFTSGSTTQPRGVLVRHRQIIENVSATGARIVMEPHDHLVSWLPLFHDMGFIGGLCFSLYWACGLSLIPTETFLRSPNIWLRRIAETHATLSPCPTFALDVLAPRASRLRDLDLSSWRYATVGSEPVFHQTLTRFEQAFGPCGLPETTLHAAYGLAEATLCVTTSRPGSTRQTEWIDPRGLREHGKAESCDVERGGAPFVGCGTPLDNIKLKVAGPDSETLEERTVGRILIQGPCVTDGYFAVDSVTDAGPRDKDGLPGDNYISPWTTTTLPHP